MKFNQYSIECAYIQNLLRNTYLPSIPYYTEEEISDTNIFTEIPVNSQFIVKNKIYSKNEDDSKTLLRTFADNEFITGITMNLYSNASYYDSTTHEIFGEYLRYYCYKHNVHLMSLYNCYSNRYINNSKLPLVKDSQNHISASKNNSTNLILVKVKFGKSYDIRIDKQNIIYSQLGFYDGNKFCEIFLDKSTTDAFEFTSTYKQISVLNNQSNIYKVPDASEFTSGNAILKNEQLRTLRAAEKYLYLILEVTNILNLNTVVIEQEDSIWNLNPSLCKLDFDTRPFSDKLLSYILDISISPASKIHKNIERIQEQLFKYGIMDSNGSVQKLPATYTKGNFDIITQSYIYNTFRSSQIIDFIGYVDKDVEELIYKGRNYAIN